MRITDKYRVKSKPRIHRTVWRAEITPFVDDDSLTIGCGVYIRYKDLARPGLLDMLVFGAGNFGSCLADHLGDSSHTVYMWSRSEKIVNHFNQYHRNPEALQDHLFAESITAVGPDFPTAEMVQSMDVLLFAIPTEGVR